MQREGITHAQVSNLFYANMALGGFVSLALVLFAPAIASFFHEPRLTHVTWALSATFLLSSATVQHLALLKRQIRFGTIALIQVSAMAVGSVTGIGMAWLGLGYWSLVGIQLSAVTAALFLTVVSSRWRPQLPTRRSGTWPLLQFGANLTAGGFLWSLARGSDSLLIGKFLGSVPLGFYSRAQALVVRPLEQFVNPLESVFVPILSRLQTDHARYRRTVLKVYDIIAVIAFPAAALILVLARPLTLLILGPKWEAAADIVRGVSPVALYTPVACVSSCLLASQGRGRDFLRINFIASLATAVGFAAGLPFGASGVAIAYSATCFAVHLPLQYYVAGRTGPVTTTDLWRRFFMHLPLWGIVLLATSLMLMVVSEFAPIYQLFFAASAGLSAAGVSIYATVSGRSAALTVFEALQEWRAGRARSKQGTRDSTPAVLSSTLVDEP
jgi:polysaccharide transporter, PST family